MTTNHGLVEISVSNNHDKAIFLFGTIPLVHLSLELNFQKAKYADIGIYHNITL